MNHKIWLSPPQLAFVRHIAQTVMRICNIPHKEAFQIAKNACVFNAPKRYAGGKTAMRSQND